jgi:HAD superfamily hydrolase (TIGR01509 family)
VNTSPADTRKLAAVLFDMDGTLLDSEKIWDVALDELAHELGGTLSREARVSMIGSSVGRSVSIVHADLQVEADAEQSGRYLLERAAALFRTDLEFRPGARDLLDAVRDAGVPAALVTSTHRWLTEIALDTLGRDYFQVTVCGDEVPRPKPNPDPYQQAMRMLGVPAPASVAIEDSALGVASAEAAGCTVLAVPSEVELTPGLPTTVVRSSLTGLTVADLAALLPA